MTVSTTTTAGPINPMAKTGRPEEFNDSQQSTFVGLVGVGLSRRQAAIYLGFSPSTVTKRVARDPVLAGRLRQAELEREHGLLSKMMHQSDRSWRAAAWLLERIHPERYAKGKAAAAQPSLDEVFDKVTAIVAEVVPDAAVREALESRLSVLAATEFEDVACPLPAPCDFESPAEFERTLDPQATAAPIDISTLLEKSAAQAERVKDEETWQRLIDKKRGDARRERLLREFHDAGYGHNTVQSAAAFAAAAKRPSHDGNSPWTAATRHDLPAEAAPDFFNTSPPAHEERVLKNICG